MTNRRPTVLGLAPSFGFGDRLGLATPGHLDALRAEGAGIRAIFAQQSIREMARTQRTPIEVMASAANVVVAEGFDEPWGADADHLKTKADVEATAHAGFVFFTIDPSDHVDTQVQRYDAATLAEKFNASEVDWVEQYPGKTILVENGPAITFDDLTVKRAVLKYGRAISHSRELAAHIDATMKQLDRDYEIEISVDETPEPTTPAEHYIIADQLIKHGVKLVSLAPRFMGDFEKGVDYKGSLAVFEQSLAEHAAIARQLGPYKLSLHSGSDKLSIYSIFARVTRGLFHVKTAGTSYLEALRVAARHDEQLFRRLIDFARDRFDLDKATYHVSAKVAGVPAPSQVDSVRELERIYLECWCDVPPGEGFTNPGRQILHCTFGSAMTDATLGPALRELLVAHADTYRQLLADHFGKHLAALRVGMQGS